LHLADTAGDFGIVKGSAESNAGKTFIRMRRAGCCEAAEAADMAWRRCEFDLQDDDHEITYLTTYILLLDRGIFILFLRFLPGHKRWPSSKY
jgi:hypothetical protein